MKPNKQWYPYPRYGSFFKLEDGELYQCPMNLDGSREDSPTWVDFGSGVEPHDMASSKSIIQELEIKD
jgi:hypothetical protein